MFTQPRDTNNETKPAYKSTALIVTEAIIPSQLISRNEAMTKKNEKHTQNQNLLKSRLYSSFVLLPVIEQNVMILAIEVVGQHATLNITQLTPNKTYIV